MHCMRHVHVLTSEPAFFGGYQSAPIHVDIHWLFILQVFITLFEVSSFSIQTQCPTILSVLASLLSADLNRWKSEWVWELLLARLFSGQGERLWVCVKEAYTVFHQAQQNRIEQKQLTSGGKNSNVKCVLQALVVPKVLSLLQLLVSTVSYFEKPQAAP